MPSGRKPRIALVEKYEDSNVWILPSGLAINRHRIMYVTPAVDPAGKKVDPMAVLLEVGDQAVTIQLDHPKDRTALRQAILALGVEIG